MMNCIQLVVVNLLKNIWYHLRVKPKIHASDGSRNSRKEGGGGSAHKRGPQPLFQLKNFKNWVWSVPFLVV